MSFAIAPVLWLALFSDPYPAAAPPDSIARLVDLLGLPRVDPRVTCRQFASTDPAGRGDDHGHFLRLDGRRAVLAEMEGPGVIVRLWSANAAGRLRIHLDGEPAPRIDCPFQDLFTGRYPPFVEPIATHQGGGWISYHPIPYARSCRVEVDDLEHPEALYYHVQYLTYPAGTPIRTFTRELPAGERSALETTLASWRASSNGPMAAGDRRVEASQSIGPGEAVALTPLAGPGVIVELRVKPKDPAPQMLRGLVLEITADETSGPNVLCPLGDFFGVGFGPRVYRGLVLGWDEDGGTSRFPIPFRKEARVRVSNGSRAKASVSVSAVYRPLAVIPDDVGAFHAEFRAVDGVGEDLYEIASIEGPGKYVGVSAALQGVSDLWYLEGNEELTVDGEAKPGIVGTGTEDFFNGGWYWEGGPIALPLHGLGLKEEWTTNRTTPYRIQVPDAIPVARSLVAKIEHGSANAVRDAYYSTVAFWYGPPRPVRRPVSEALRLPRLWVTRPRAAFPAVTLDWKTEASATACAWESVSEEYRGAALSLHQAFPVSHFERARPAVHPDFSRFAGVAGDRFEAPLEIDEADRYRVVLRTVGHPETLAADVAIDGRPLGRIEPKAERVAPLPPIRLGSVGLGRGRHAISLRIAESARPAAWIGLDSIALERDSPFVRAWWVGPPVEASPGTGVEWASASEATFVGDGFDPAMAGWTEVRAEGDALDLNALVTKRAPVLGYLLTFVRSPRPLTTRARLGSDDGVRAWVNGSLVWSHAIHRPLTIDEDAFDVRLEHGWNRILVKVRNDDGGYGLSLRLADPELELTFSTRRE